MFGRMTGCSLNGEVTGQSTSSSNAKKVHNNNY